MAGFSVLAFYRSVLTRIGGIPIDQNGYMLAKAGHRTGAVLRNTSSGPWFMLIESLPYEFGGQLFGANRVRCGERKTAILPVGKTNLVGSHPVLEP
jgi:hypothetical protein